MRHLFRLIAATTLIATAACAHGPEAPPSPPNYAPLAGQPTGPHARLYADCIRLAAAAGHYRQVIDGGDELLLFTCSGSIAQAFWDALGPHSERMGSAFEHDGRRYRSTAKVERNMVGVDYCTVDAAGGDARCVMTFNAGDFLIASD
ncbi:hypothetical protein [Brevundimonas sp. GCM10030266]|uniref:hypothetical protein n=1 Tax=Brevundimonas sp. GCM10030266 TaxID=3273386 RepID=UPI003609492B